MKTARAVIVAMALTGVFTVTGCGGPGMPRDPLTAVDYSEPDFMDTELLVTNVLQVLEDNSRRRFEVVTNRMATLWGDSQTFDVHDLDLLRTARDQKTPISIQSETKTKRIIHVFYPVIEGVVFLSPLQDGEEDVRITLTQRPSQLMLNKKQPRFDELYALLLKSHNDDPKGVQAVMAVLPGDSKVMDVVLLTPVEE